MIRIFILGLAIFALLRIALFVVYNDYFAHSDLISALLQGMRFDAQLLALVSLPFALLLALPFSKLNSLLVRKFSIFFSGLILIILSGLALADIAYFGEVHRHIGSEILNLKHDWLFIVQTALGTRWPYAASGVFVFLIIIWLYRKWAWKSIQPLSSCLKTRLFFSFGYLILLLLMARGFVVSGKPLNSVDAFKNGNQTQANLTLNGPLITLKEICKRQNQQALTYLDSATYQTLEKQYPQPFLYQSQNQPSGKNIVFILLESWSYRYIDGLSGNQYGVTPYTDQLIKKSQVWQQFYAAGQRSIIGIQATLTSVPALPEREPLGFGLELNNISRIAQLASQHGYRTLMAQSSKRRSFHMDGIAKALGFQEYFGQEDMPILRDYPQAMPPYGWDYEALQFLGQQISKQAQQPFFAFLFTGTTHEPFANAGAEFLKYPHDEKGENGFLNTLAYSDWALQEFMNYAEKQDWYHNTIFVFTADHTLNSASKTNDIKEKFHIPLIIFDPSHPVAQKHTTLSSQYDLLPTFADILGIQTPISTFGQSLLQNKKGLPLMLNQGDTIAAIAPDGSSAQFQEKNLISGSLNPEDMQFLHYRIQKADELLRPNRWTNE